MQGFAIRVLSNSIDSKGRRHILNAPDGNLIRLTPCATAREAGMLKDKQVVTHTFPLDRITEAFDTAINTQESIKVMIEL